MAATVAYHLGYLPGGFIGVDVFFVLSGFLVTSLLLTEVEPDGSETSRAAIDLRSFWVARLRRLTPAVLVVTPTVLWTARVAGWPASRLDELAVDGAATLTWWQNWRQILAGQSYWDPSPSPFRHAWSLSIEEQYYLVWPLVAALVVVGLARRSGWNPWLLRRSIATVAGLGALVSAAWHVILAHRLDRADLSRVYLGTDTRVFALLIGCALACSRWGLRRSFTREDPDDGAPAPDDPPSRHRAGDTAGEVGTTAGLRNAGAVSTVVLVILAMMMEVDDPRLFRSGGFVAVAMLAAVVVAGQAAPPRLSPATAPMGLGWVVGGLLSWLGSRSYAIYLWSWPIQVLASYRWPTMARGLLSAGVVVSALVAAEVSHRLVEDPLRRGRGWAAAPWRRRPAWVLGVVTASVSVIGAYGAATVAPVHQRLETADALEQALARPSMPPEASGSGAEGLGVLVIGDSVSFTIGLYKPERDALPAGLRWLDSRAVIGCGVMAAQGWEYPDDEGGFVVPSSGDCVRQADAEKLGLAQRPDVVVTFPGAWETEAVRSPDGEVVAARSPRMAEVLSDNLVARATEAHRVGAAFIVVAWACPGEGTPPGRADPEFIDWVNGVFRSAMGRARRSGADARYLEPGPESCTGGLAGTPTEARRGWMADSNHVLGWEQGLSFWNEWLGPALVEEMTQR
ncbi:MAG: acyltransferase [Microthrixaceae bacterium]|nr:acyltransferase [Microthrixaceae bacterium]